MATSVNVCVEVFLYQYHIQRLILQNNMCLYKHNIELPTFSVTSFVQVYCSDCSVKDLLIDLCDVVYSPIYYYNCHRVYLCKIPISD